MAAKKRSRAKETIARYDSADYLKNEAEIAEYLRLAVEDSADDSAAIAHALGVAARARGMVQLSKDTGITRSGLYKALSSGGNPSFDTVTKVMKAFGLKLVPKKAA